MSDKMYKRVHWAEEQLEARLMMANTVGKAVGLEDFAAQLMDSAGNAYKVGRDDEASTSRALAHSMLEVAQTYRVSYRVLCDAYKIDFPDGDVDSELDEIVKRKG